MTSTHDARGRLDSPLSLAEGLAELVESCRCLTRYAVETDQLPSSVDVKRLYKIRRKFEAGDEELSDDDFGFLVGVYETLERRLGPVNVDTLLATEDSVDQDGRIRPSLARRYVRYLFMRTLVIIALLLAGHLVHFLFPLTLTTTNDSEGIAAISAAIRERPILVAGLIAAYLIPFLYGALGADAFLLRETTRKLHMRQFDPRRIPENRARFLLGTMSGGVIVFFVSANVLDSPTSIFNVGGAALGFVAGFSTDFLFDAIDRIVNALLPRGSGGSSGLDDRRANDELLQRYRQRMDEAETPEEKEVLKGVVEDLEARARYRS